MPFRAGVPVAEHNADPSPVTTAISDITANVGAAAR